MHRVDPERALLEELGPGREVGVGIAGGELGHLRGEVKEGLEEEAYEFKNRMGSGTAIRHLMQVTTSDSKKFS